MQINSASLLAAQQARAAPQRPAPKPSSADELFEPLFGKAEAKPAASSSAPAQNSPATASARPGSQLDIRI